MNTKRRDSKNRVLLDGELQRKDGRYEYRYYDIYGNRKCVYSWKLTDSDYLPRGKRDCISLRELERQINRDLYDGIDTQASKNVTLNQKFDKYISQADLKPSTKQNYMYMYDNYVRETLGKKNFYNISCSEIKTFLNEFIRKGFRPSSIDTIHSLINPMFKAAVEDGLMRKNPYQTAMTDLKKAFKRHPNSGDERVGLTTEQQKALLDFMKSNNTDPRWIKIITVLLGTGLRIGECIGLTWDSCDFSKNTITVKRTLNYRKWEDGRCYFKVFELPKTKAGRRQIPMFPEVRNILLEEYNLRHERKTPDDVIDGVTGWIFTNRFGKAVKPKSVNNAIKRIINKYNKAEEELAVKEKRNACFLPKVTNHILRHTFCTRLVEESIKPECGINVKIIQTLMGHAHYSTTMDTYTTITEEIKKQAIKNIQANIYLG